MVRQASCERRYCAHISGGCRRMFRFEPTARDHANSIDHHRRPPHGRSPGDRDGNSDRSSAVNPLETKWRPSQSKTPDPPLPESDIS